MPTHRCRLALAASPRVSPRLHPTLRLRRKPEPDAHPARAEPGLVLVSLTAPRMRFLIAGVAAPMKKVAILQSNYIPWKGYFDLLASVDEFILYDDMQYTRRDWRNRNRIKTPRGPQWLTVPVKVSGRFHQSIRETELDGAEWAGRHWKTLAGNYRQAPHYPEIARLLEPSYLGTRHTHLSQLNRVLLETICGYLGIRTKISNSWDYTLINGKTERLADLCIQAGGTEYVSGPAARDYLDEGHLHQRGLKLTWFDYDGYPEYPQLWGAFDHHVSIVDLLFNCGPNAPRYLRHSAQP
jgi:hypothetical protein